MYMYMYRVERFFKLPWPRYFSRTGYIEFSCHTGFVQGKVYNHGKIGVKFVSLLGETFDAKEVVSWGHVYTKQHIDSENVYMYMSEMIA